MKSKSKQPKMGRPPKKAQDLKSLCVLVRLTPGEFAELKADGEKMNLPMSNVLREAWKRQREKEA